MVNFASILSSTLAASLMASLVVAHPGEKHDMAHVKRQIDARQLRAAAAKRSLSLCQNSLKHRELMQRSVQRRANNLHALRERRGIKVSSRKLSRDLATLQAFEAVNHNETGLLDYNIETPESTIFSANTSCILAPEVTDGPYYITGELLRKNVKEAQYCAGVDLYLEVQYIDITTCAPVPNLYVDIWNANATGVYSGIVATGNSAAGGWNSTYLRGIQSTDSDGVASFETIVPGHYDGRAVHTHLLTKSNVTVNTNGTTSGGAVTHIGQMFYPESLLLDVNSTYPYTLNTQAVTTNDEDMWSIVQAADDYDPFPEFIYLGDSVADGLLAWIQIGINSTADYTDDDYYQIAAYRDASGGHENTDSGAVGGGGGGNGSMTGTPPSGTGTPPSGTAMSLGFETSTTSA